MEFYDMIVDLSRCRLSITFHKHLWTMNDIGPFAVRCREAVDALQQHSSLYRTLIYFKECHIQSQQIFSVMDAIVKGSNAEKIALVADNPLARMQTKRLVSAGHIRFFDNLDASQAWLNDADQMAV